jgi:uncharacterized membrane protein YkvA (DUF1232 family)
MSVRDWARRVKRDVIAVYLAARDPRLPWYTKTLAILVAGYALSPIDLIPDFIPVLGYLDDLILVPAGLTLVIRLMPPDLLAECRMTAERISNRPTSRTAGVAIVIVWLAVAAAGGWWLFHRYAR